MNPETALALVFSLVIAGGVLIVIAGMRHRTKVLEMMHRERLAMIERGTAPPGELDATPVSESSSRRSARGNRLLSLGIVIVGLGLGLAVLLGFASGEPETAVGVGGAVAIIGAALIVTALVVHGHRNEDDLGLAKSRPDGDRRSFPSDPSV